MTDLALPTVPWQLTGNHWLALPCIHPADGAIHAVGMLHRGARAAVEFAGDPGFIDGAGEPLLRPRVEIDGVLQDLAAEIARRGLPVKITVIGSLHGRADAAVIRTTGPFARPDLPRLISESGANVFLLPSICPETFSYVTQELMSLRVPLACFDFGAPADRVAAYGLGRVVPRASSADLLDQLLRFHQDVATRHSELA